MSTDNAQDASTVLPPIVSTEWLVANRSDVFVADVRWYLDGRPASVEFEAGHVAGAVFVDMDTDLSDHGQPAAMGRHPLPSPEYFAAAMGRLGIDGNTPVVAYDDSGGATAGRLVVMLRSLGCPAAILDGGMRAWPGALAGGPEAPPVPVVFRSRPWPADRFATADEVGSVSEGRQPGLLLDARSGDRYRGESEPIDPRAGHVPGAVNAPWAANLDGATGRFLPAAHLQDRYASLGVSDTVDVVCYCGSGVSACADVLAIEHAGFRPPRLFVPSWSGWSSDPDRPVAAGDG